MSNPEEISTSAFDFVAKSYDTDFTFSNIGKLQRKRVYHFLEKTLPQNTRLEILEINCGTGEDALWLAGKGHHVISTDASEKMIEKAEAKLRSLKSEVRNQHLKFEAAAFDDLIKNYSNKEFDLIFSNFGGLNCMGDTQLKKLSADLSSLLKPNGKFIAVIMGRKCLWEQFYFLCKLNVKKAFRRLSKEGVNAPLASRIQKTFYYSPAELKKITQKEFSITMTKPIGITIPPSYLEPFFRKKTRLLEI